MVDGPVDQLRRALGAVEDLVAGVHDDQWAAPTPCAGWTVRDLLSHLVGGNLLVAGLLAGDPLPPDRAVQGPIDHLADDPLSAYRRSASALLEAFEVPERLDRPVDMPVGTVLGVVAVHLRITETLVHGWDLARATGQPNRLPEDLADQALAFTTATLPKVPAGRTPFAEPKPVDQDAPAIDRLAALLGRAVG